MARTASINFPSERACAAILQILAPYSETQRRLILAVVEANTTYPDGWSRLEDCEDGRRVIEVPEATVNFVEDPWEPRIREFMAGRDEVTLDLIFGNDCLGRPGEGAERRTQADANRVAAILQRLGWRKRRIPYTTEYVYGKTASAADSGGGAK